jgi:hypothetical protein
MSGEAKVNGDLDMPGDEGLPAFYTPIKRLRSVLLHI